MEKTFVILKPDCIKQNLVGTILSLFAEKNFKICASKMVHLSEDLLKVHYAHVANYPFFPEIVSFMRSQPVLLLALQGEGVIKRTRDLLGPTDSTSAPKGTIRGDYGTNKMKNIAHASDSPESAREELQRFFSEDEIFDL